LYVTSYYLLIFFIGDSMDKSLDVELDTTMWNVSSRGKIVGGGELEDDEPTFETCGGKELGYR